MQIAPAFLLTIVLLSFLSSCVLMPTLYKHDSKNKVKVGQLDASTYITAKELIHLKTGTRIKDTIIIKYDYNNETCWDLLDQKDDEYIKGFPVRHKERVEQLLATRKNVSLFSFREPGNHLNKIVKWDNSIIIDTSKQLFHLLFKKRAVCGNSIIILPDRRFVLLRSDAHFDAMDLTQSKIVAYLEGR